MGPRDMWNMRAPGIEPRSTDYTLRKKYFQTYCIGTSAVTNIGRYSVPGRTKWYLDRPTGIQMEEPWSKQTTQYAYHGPSRYCLVLRGTIRSFQVLTRVPYLWQAEAPKMVLGSTFFLRVYIDSMPKANPVSSEGNFLFCQEKRGGISASAW